MYRWTNKINGKTYIGSSTNLGRRFRCYFNNKHISNAKTNILIYKALVLYGYPNFKLEILEYCAKDEVLIREQYYLDTNKPEYNILKFAGSRLGHKHTAETKAKISSSIKMMIQDPKFQKRITQNLQPNRKPIIILNIDNNISHTFPSIIQTAEYLGISRKTVWKYLKSKKVYKEK